MKETNQARISMVLFGITSLVMVFLATIFPPLILFFPYRFIIQAANYGIGKSMLMYAGICLIFGGVIGIKGGLALFILFGPLIVAMYYCIRHKYKVVRTVMTCTLILMGSITAVLCFSGALASIQSGAIFDQIYKTQEAVLNTMELNTLQRDDVLLSMKNGLGLVRQFLPSILLLLSLLTVYLSFVFTGRKLLLNGKVINQPSSFIFFRLPGQLILTALVATIAFIIATQVFNVDLEILRLNALFTISALLMVQGASVIYFFLFQTIRSIILRWLILGLILLMPGFQVGLIVSGLLDKILNIRQLKD